MIGVTIGIGPGWDRAAGRCARRMHEMTGQRCVVIGEAEAARCPAVAHPSWLKCFVPELFPEENSFFVFDADLLPLREWSPAGIFSQMGRTFCAVPDRASQRVYEECAEFLMPFPDWYVNGGLLIFGREHARILERTFSFHPKYGKWLEQTALNEALREDYDGKRVEVARLPRQFNRLIAGDYRVTDEINLHPAGLKDPEQLMALRDQIWGVTT